MAPDSSPETTIIGVRRLFHMLRVLHRRNLRLLYAIVLM